MPGTSSGSGGKRKGAGRKSGAEWQSKRPQKVMVKARQTLVQIMEEGRDPLLSLLEIADSPETPLELRVKAYQAALPYCRPRLSMQVTADATPKDGQQEVSGTHMVEKISQMLEAFKPQQKPVIDLEPENETKKTIANSEKNP